MKVDEIGSGVRNVFKYLKVYANGTKPMFIEDDLFKTVIPLRQGSWDNRTRMIIAFLDLQISELGERRLAELAEISLSMNLAQLKDDDEFLFSWGGSLMENGGKLFPNRTSILLRILIACIVPVSNDELLEITHYSSREKFRELYLMPLRKDGLIEYLIKDKPSSPNQKYILTEKGKMFLGGFSL